MLTLKALVDCIGLALIEKGRKALTGDRSFGDVLPDVAKSALDFMHKSMVTEEIRQALAMTVTCPAWDYDETLTKVVDGIAKVQALPFREKLVSYLSTLPVSVRQVLRRPSDPDGRTTPDKLEFYKGDELLPFLPPRIPRFKPGDRLAGIEEWELGVLRGLGECSEVWEAFHDEHTEVPSVALKFAIDPETVERVRASRSLFEQVFALNETHGIVPLRSIFFDTDPPCFEYGYVSGYDLTSLINDWNWRYDTPKPEAALKIIRRITDIVAKAHARKIVHRDLKPSNVLLHPTHDGKFTIWITDYGWGQIESARSLELARGGTPRGEQLRLSYRGAHTPLYASPQQQKREAPDLRDDVHALGVIWFQLLQRDPHAAPPVGTEWAEAFESYGFTESQQRLLTACLSVRPEKRPASAVELAEQLSKVTVGSPVGTDGSKLIAIKAFSSVQAPPLPATVSVRGQKVKSGDDPAALAAASLLKIDWGNAGVPLAMKSSDLPNYFRNSIGMSFVLIPSGRFEMGAFDDEKGRKDCELPRHTVAINRAFYLSTHAVTQQQYELVMGKNPSSFGKVKGGTGEHPVESVTWHDADKFCAKLNKRHEELQLDRKYRLPFEAEWEYACRAGTETPYNTGQKLTERDAAFNLGLKGHPSPVGRFPGNPWGLFDMHGNVAEWCMDWFDDYYYFDSPGVDPRGPKGGLTKVTRGGSFACTAYECRSASRISHPPDRVANTIGFRVVLMVNK
jgi:formylglycine-generating enzyme required for sulfatase activity